LIERNCSNFVLPCAINLFKGSDQDTYKNTGINAAFNGSANTRYGPKANINPTFNDPPDNASHTNRLTNGCVQSQPAGSELQFARIVV
jgi:hypothetical protein